MAASATAALSGIGIVSNVLGELLDYQSEVLLSLARNLNGFDKHLFHIFYQRSAIYLWVAEGSAYE
jgi:hypothetical protein